MRGRSNEHLIAVDHGEGHREGDQWWRYEALCGEKFTASNWVVQDESHWRCCRKCNALYFRVKLDAEPNGFSIGANLTDEEKEALGQRWRFRHMSPVTDAEGREWGWIAMEGGWGERWQFVTWSPYAPGDVDKLGGKIGAPVFDGRGNALKFGSKEAVLYKLPALIVEHRIKDRAAKIADAEASRKEAAADRARRDEEQRQWAERDALRKAQEAEDRAAQLDGLRSIRDTFGAALSNQEMSALKVAIVKFGGDTLE